MAQHFLLSAAARSLSPAKVARMSDRGAENVFLRLRWPETDGKPLCPRCGCQICYDCRRSEHQPRWRCKACGADFSVTSGTLFAWHKLPLRTYLSKRGKSVGNHSFFACPGSMGYDSVWTCHRHRPSPI